MHAACHVSIYSRDRQLHTQKQVSAHTSVMLLAGWSPTRNFHALPDCPDDFSGSSALIRGSTAATLRSSIPAGNPRCQYCRAAVRVSRCAYRGCVPSSGYPRPCVARSLWDCSWRWCPLDQPWRMSTVQQCSDARRRLRLYGAPYKFTLRIRLGTCTGTGAHGIPRHSRVSPSTPHLVRAMAFAHLPPCAHAQEKLQIA